MQSIVGLGSRDDAAGSELAKSSVMTGLRRVDPLAVRFIRQRQNQTGNGQRTTTGISEAEQRRKQYQAGVEVTSTGSEFQGRAVRGQTQGNRIQGKRSEMSAGARTRLRGECMWECCLNVCVWMRCRCGETIKANEWMVTAVWLV